MLVIVIASNFSSGLVNAKQLDYIWIWMLSVLVPILVPVP